MKKSEFIKIGLNALAKYEIAKSRGVLPEAGTAWRWAGRKLAPVGTGYTGTRVERSLERIGALPEKAYQEQLKKGRKLGKKGREVLTTVQPSGKHKVFKGQFAGAVATDKMIAAIDTSKHISHTHPEDDIFLNMSNKKLGKKLLSKKRRSTRGKTKRIVRAIEFKDGLLNRASGDEKITNLNPSGNYHGGDQRLINMFPKKNYSIVGPQSGIEHVISPGRVSRKTEIMRVKKVISGKKKDKVKFKELRNQLYPKTSDARLREKGYSLSNRPVPESMRRVYLDRTRDTLNK